MYKPLTVADFTAKFSTTLLLNSTCILKLRTTEYLARNKISLVCFPNLTLANFNSSLKVLQITRTHAEDQVARSPPSTSSHPTSVVPSRYRKGLLFFPHSFLTTIASVPIPTTNLNTGSSCQNQLCHTNCSWRRLGNKIVNCLLQRR